LPEAAAADVAAQITRLARPVPSSTHYAEVRFVRVLKKPLLMRGELDYGGAGKLGKRVQQPYRETTAIDGGRVEVQREGRAPRRFPLDRAPELQALLAGFSALLGGDPVALQKIFIIGFVQNAAKWTLTLTPHEAALAKHLQQIVVDGVGDEPLCFSLQQADGDASVMLLGALAAATLPDPPTRSALAAICQRVAP
jgi:hypothetical protein